MSVCVCVSAPQAMKNCSHEMKPGLLIKQVLLLFSLFIWHLLSTELKITVGHWPFSSNIAISAEQNLNVWTNLLYISYEEATIMFLLLINCRPISNPYFKLCINITDGRGFSNEAYH